MVFAQMRANGPSPGRRAAVAIETRLDEVMAERGVKLVDLAERVGLTNANLSHIKTGKIRAIRFSTLDALCEELDCQPGDILKHIKDK